MHLTSQFGEANMTVSAHAEEQNPRTTTYEFFGPPGALAVTVGAPCAIYYLTFCCSETIGGCPAPLPILVGWLAGSIKHASLWRNLWDSEATLLYLTYYAFCVVSWYLLPGKWLEGSKLRNGGRVRYKMNGMCLPALTAIRPPLIGRR